MILIMIVVFVVAAMAQAQVANHEPGETLAHFLAVEKNTPSDCEACGSRQRECIENIKREIAETMHEKYEDPGTCTFTPWKGKTYKFRHDVLVKIEANTRVSYAEAVGILEARYGEPVDRRHAWDRRLRAMKLRDHEAAFERAYWHVKAFGVWALDISYVDDQGAPRLKGDSGRYVSVIVEADSEHPAEIVNPKF
jgi:hypothetical protein